MSLPKQLNIFANASSNLWNIFYILSPRWRLVLWSLSRHKMAILVLNHCMVCLVNDIYQMFCLNCRGLMRYINKIKVSITSQVWQCSCYFGTKWTFAKRFHHFWGCTTGESWNSFKKTSSRLLSVNYKKNTHHVLHFIFIWSYRCITILSAYQQLYEIN